MHDVYFVGCPPKEDISCFSSFPMKKYRYYVDTRFKVLSSFLYMQRNMLLLQRIRKSCNLDLVKTVGLFLYELRNKLTHTKKREWSK